jgi:uncharacterized protein (TIGR03790 family)
VQAVYLCGKAESIAGRSQAAARRLASRAIAARKFRRGPATSPSVTVIRKFLPALLVAWLLVVPAGAAGSAADRVILLANRDDPDSLRIAQHYAEARGVPLANIIVQSMPLTETITWTEFITTVWQPLQDELVRRGWIDAIPMDLVDEVGRRKNAISGHHLSYLIVCRGVPLRIRHDPARYQPHPPLTDNPYFRTNEAAVDSELSLLARTDSAINGLLANPLYGNDHPTPWQLAQVVKVSRLDGPTATEAAALVDRAISAERTGLLGRAYVDQGGIHPDGDTWLKAVAAQLAGLGFDLTVDQLPATFAATARMDAPVLYFGWYAGNLNGPFALPGFQFPPGAIAEHIHSSTATTLRSNQEGWSGPLVARGVTATVGNVFEPYLQLLHRPDLLVRALARGETFGDAAYYAEPALSWQTIAIGDPLYRPFARSFEEQWADRSALPSPLAAYAAVRQAGRLKAGHHLAAARAVLRAALKAHPALPLGYALARELEQAEDPAGAVAALAFVPALTGFQPDTWGLVHETAALLVRCGAPARAVQVYRHLFEEPSLPLELQRAWQGEAQAAAVAAGDQDQADAWGEPKPGRPTGTKK